METEVEDLGSTDIIERPVKVNNKNYVVVEADGDTASKFRGMQLSNFKISDGKAAGILPGLSDSELFLVSRCLFELFSDDKGTITRRAVPIAVIKLWPNRITSRIFEIAQEISELKEPETVEELRKQINELQAELDKKINDQQAGKEDDPAKNGQ